MVLWKMDWMIFYISVFLTLSPPGREKVENPAKGGGEGGIRKNVKKISGSCIIPFPHEQYLS
jgi:hypothetical protein